MHHTKKLIVPSLCILLGCAGGAAMGSVTAQTWPQPTTIQRWQQECVPTVGSGDARSATAAANQALRTRGEEGWEAFSVDNSRTCFKRPAP